MNSSLRKFVSGTWTKLKSRSRFDPGILLELLEHETDREVIQDILGIDIMNESMIRNSLKKTLALRYSRLIVHVDRRIALRIILKEKIQDDELSNLFFRSLSYPLVLFFLSMGMLLFTDMILIRSFQTMLDFMGPDPSFGTFQILIKIGILFDGILVFAFGISAILIKFKPVSAYDVLNRYFKQNFWKRIIAIRFLSRFTMLYDLGYSTDQIMMLIERSGDPILSFKVRVLSETLTKGKTLSESVGAIDETLRRSFLMGEEGINDERVLTNTLKQRESQLKLMIKRVSRMILSYAYLKITLIIVMIYGLMLKPVEMMENLL